MRYLLPEATKLDMRTGENACNVLFVTGNENRTGMDLPEEVLSDAGESGKIAI